MAAAARAATSARADPSPRRPPRPAHAEPRTRPLPQGRRVRVGVLWIVVIGALLAGIVALNVAVLGLTMDSDRLDGRIQELQTRNAELQSDLSSASAAGRIEAAAPRLGL